MPIDYIPGEEIERKSLNIIDEKVSGHTLDRFEWAVARRMIHTSADFSIIPLLRFHAEPVQSGIAALKKGASIVTDVNMLKQGISVKRLSKINPVYEQGLVFCNVADEGVAKTAREHNLPRSIFNIRSLKDRVDAGIVCIGNAPTALAEVCRLIEEENIVPSLLIAMPVGFVNVVESKELVKSLSVPYILMDGNRGGSTFAVAALNAISIMAADA